MAMKFDKKKVKAVVYQVTVTVMNEFGEEREFTTESQHFDTIIDKLYQFRTIINNTYEFKEPEVTEF